VSILIIYGKRHQTASCDQSMAHLPSSTAFFSPSVARVAASTAKDWNYIDSWLSSMFHNRTPPPFERNPETLKVLLALASLNESADEERDLLARADADALQELGDTSPSLSSTPVGLQPPPNEPLNLRDGILSAVERDLPRDGAASLEAMASLANTLAIAYPEPEALGRRMVDLQANVFELEQMKARVEILRRFVHHETRRMETLVADLQSGDYQPSSDLAKQNLETQRKIKAMTAKLPELKDRVSALATSIDDTNPTIERIAAEEHDYLTLLTEKKELDSQLSHFHNLPTDTDSARAELEHLRSKLRQVTERRDAVFEGLVERKSPTK
jgi:HAUS augmin-like complex subunit 1